MRGLGIDYGRRRIGLALSDATGLLARPWKTIVREGSESDVLEAAAAVAREVAALQSAEDGLAVVVVGWPRRLNGEPHEQTRAVEAFVGHLRTAIDVPVVLQDERLTSWEAESLLTPREADWRKRKQQVDSMAAAIILQNYLDGLPRRQAAEDLDS
jgi:putative Holliday junction resolvase